MMNSALNDFHNKFETYFNDYLWTVKEIRKSIRKMLV